MNLFNLSKANVQDEQEEGKYQASSSQNRSSPKNEFSTTNSTPQNSIRPTQNLFNSASSEKIASFVDTRSAAIKKCFISDASVVDDGKEIFHAFLERKYKQSSSRAIDLGLKKLIDIGIIDGAHPLKLGWDVFVGFMIVYSAVAVPYRLGFSLDSTGGWAVVDYTVDAIFLMDMIISFNTSFSSGGKEIIRNRKAIAKHYLKTWFIPDFISTFPFDAIVFLTVKSFSSDNLRTFKLVRVLRLFRLLKIFRIVRINRKLQNAKAGGIINVFVYDLLMVMTSVFFMAHFFSCIFHQFLNCVPGEDTYSSCGNHAAYSQYLIALSWSLQTILNIGYGNVVLTSVGGRIFSIFAMIGGAILFGFVLAVMMQAASNKTPWEEEEQRNVALIGAYLNERNISYNLKLSIWRHCRYYYSRKASYDEPDIFQTAPAALRHRFFNTMKSSINKLQIFERNFTILSRIHKHMHPLRVEPGDSVIHQGDYCTDLFFVQKGLIHAFVQCARTKFQLTFVGEFCKGYDFNMANALRLRDTSWATYRASVVSDLLWIDTTRMELADDIMQEFDLQAMQELKLQDQVEALYSNLTVMDDESELFATPSVICKRQMVLLADIGGDVVHYKELQSSESCVLKKAKLYKVFRPVPGVPKTHEIVLESSSDMRKRFIINPSSKMKSQFDGYIALCTVLVIVLLPLRMGFSIEVNNAWTVYDIIIEVSFILDIIISFFTAYEMSDMVINTDKGHISARYLKSWFLIDVVSGLPVSMLTMNEGFLLLKLFKFARIMRLVKVMRVFKITRLLKVMKITNIYEEKPFSTSDETYVKFVRLSFIVLVFTHITACFWAKLANDRKGSNTWEDSIGVEDSSLWTRYLASFYYVYVTMNTTGYGDILAQNDLETFFSLFIIVLGAFLVAHVVAEISETNSGRDCKTERVFLLRSYLSNKQMPQTVQDAMLKQVTYANQVRTPYSEIEIWQQLPFQLRVELSVICHSAIISQFHNVFDAAVPPVVYQLLTYFEPVFIVQGAFAFTFETGSEGLFLVSSGVGEVVDEDLEGEEVVVGEHREGRVFGTECINNEPLNFVGVRAKQDMSCYRMSSTAVAVMYKEHPSLSRDFFKKIQSLYTGTRNDCTRQTPDLKVVIHKQESFGEKTLVEMGKFAKWVGSIVRLVLCEEEDVVDLRAVYNRTTLDSHPWTLPFRNKLMICLQKNSPSLVLSSDSWMQFVAMKDSSLRGEDKSTMMGKTTENDEPSTDDYTEVISEDHHSSAKLQQLQKNPSRGRDFSKLMSFDEHLNL